MAVRAGIDRSHHRSVGGLAIYNPTATQLVGFDHRPSDPAFNSDRDVEALNGQGSRAIGSRAVAVVRLTKVFRQAGKIGIVRIPQLRKIASGDR